MVEKWSIKVDKRRPTKYEKGCLILGILHPTAKILWSNSVLICWPTHGRLVVDHAKHTLLTKPPHAGAHGESPSYQNQH